MYIRGACIKISTNKVAHQSTSAQLKQHKSKKEKEKLVESMSVVSTSQHIVNYFVLVYLPKYKRMRRAIHFPNFGTNKEPHDHAHL